MGSTATWLHHMVEHAVHSAEPMSAIGMLLGALAALLLPALVGITAGMIVLGAVLGLQRIRRRER
jgi:predicted DNA repair protein MutK